MKKKEVEPVPLAPLSISVASLAFGEVPSDNFVVSRYANGKIASVYGDTKWTWTPYVESGKSAVLSFEYWTDGRELADRRTALLAEMHWLMFLLIWRRAGPTYAFRTLNHYTKLLRAMGRHCDKQRCTIRDVFTNRKRFLDFVATQPGFILRQFASLRQTLANLGPTVVGYSVLGETTSKILRGAIDKYSDGLKQHPPLPTRIYSHVITVLLKELDDFQAVSSQYLALVEACVKDPFLGRSISRRYAKSKNAEQQIDDKFESMSTLLAKFGLTAYFESKGLDISVHGLSAGLNRIMTVARLTIHAFSGMRDEEVGLLQYDCLREQLRAGKKHYIIEGTTSKHNNGKPKHVSWITSIEGKRAIDVAHDVTALNHKLWRAQAADGKKPKISYEPLFAAIACFGLGGQPPIGSDARLISAKLDLSMTPTLRKALEPIIESADLAELEQIDPHRGWHTEKKFQVGRRWTLTSHQLRRSLALYAQRSGLVSLPSLRRQLQHITEEMSRYYARGSVFAKNFIGKSKQHFGNEWQDTQPVSAFLGYLKHVLLSDDVLFGAHGNWIEHRLRDSEGIILVDREVTMRRFKNGEMAYRETLLGGCTTIDVCDKLPINWLNVHCVDGCERFVGHLSKLEQVIVVQSNLVASLDVSTPEYRSEKADLEILISARDKVYARIGRKEAS